MCSFLDANAATWLDELVEAASAEARERGQQLVAPQHLGLALTRDAQTAQLLDELGILPRRWRDHINFVLGVNEGMDADRRERVRSGHLVTARELHFDGEAVLGGAARAIVSHARSDADGRAVGPAGLLAAILTGGAGGIAAGTARWVGLTAAAVREAAGLPTAARPLLEGGIDPAQLPRPDPCGPLVLLGGGPTPSEALRAAVELADAMGCTQVAWVSAADPWAPEMAELRQRQFDAAAAGTRVRTAGMLEAARHRGVVRRLSRPRGRTRRSGARPRGFSCASQHHSWVGRWLRDNRRRRRRTRSTWPEGGRHRCRQEE